MHTIHNKSSNHLFSEAFDLYLMEDYQKALQVFLKFHKAGNNCANTNYLIGSCYYLIDPETYIATRHFEKASNHVSLTYKFGIPEEKNAPIKVYYLLAQNLAAQKKYQLSDKYSSTYAECLLIYQKYQIDEVGKLLLSINELKARLHNTII